MDCKIVKRKFNGADSLYIGQDEVSEVISETPELQIESDHNKISTRNQHQGLLFTI